MTLAFAGGTHRTVPIDLREQLAFSAEQAADALRRFRDRFPGREVVLLSTCNRVELYAAGGDTAAAPTPGQIVSFLAECRGIDERILFPVLAGDRDEAVVRHLFSVASGLDSMVLGEPQILAQVKQAWALAQNSRTSGPLTGDLFQAALRTAKRVARETALGRERLSIPSLAVNDFARGFSNASTTSGCSSSAPGKWRGRRSAISAKPASVMSSSSTARRSVPRPSPPSSAGARGGWTISSVNWPVPIWW